MKAGKGHVYEGQVGLKQDGAKVCSETSQPPQKEVVGNGDVNFS